MTRSELAWLADEIEHDWEDPVEHVTWNLRGARARVRELLEELHAAERCVDENEALIEILKRRAAARGHKINWSVPEASLDSERYDLTGATWGREGPCDRR